MISRQIERAQSISDRVGIFPILLEDRDAADVLCGTDYACRPLATVFRLSLDGQAWSRLPVNTRTGLRSSYAALEVTAEAVRADAKIVPYVEFDPNLEGDPQTLVAQAEGAQRLTNVLGTRYNQISDRLDARNVALLGLAAVHAIATWESAPEVFKGQHQQYYETNLDNGLTRLDRYLWPAE